MGCNPNDGRCIHAKVVNTGYRWIFLEKSADRGQGLRFG